MPTKVGRSRSSLVQGKEVYESSRCVDRLVVTSEFFICVGDQPELDLGGRRNPDGQGFAAFGKVIEGMDVVRKIHQEPADGQSLAPPIGITAVLRVD